MHGLVYMEVLITVPQNHSFGQALLDVGDVHHTQADIEENDKKRREVDDPEDDHEYFQVFHVNEDP